MTSQRVRRQVEAVCHRARGHPAGAGLDQQAEHVQPIVLLAVSATFLSVMRWSEDHHLFALGAFCFAGPLLRTQDGAQ